MSSTFVRTVESDELDFNVSMLSTLDQALERIWREPVIRMHGDMPLSDDAEAEIAARIRVLAREDQGPFAHPGDTAMVAYLSLLNEFSSDRLPGAAESVASARSTRFARQMAERIRRARSISSSRETLVGSRGGTLIVATGPAGESEHKLVGASKGFDLVSTHTRGSR